MANNTSHFVRLGLIVVGAVLLFYLISNYNNSKNKEIKTAENFYAPEPNSFDENHTKEMNTHINESVNNSEKDENTHSQGNTGGPKASDMNNEIYGSVNLSGNANASSLNGNQFPKDCYPKDQLAPKDLLPSDSNSKWAQVNPAGQGSLKDANFLNAGHHMGTNTVGSTNRNPNLSIRSEPANPQVKVSPWMQTTMEPDYKRRGVSIN